MSIKLIIYGPPGAGKDTQAGRLSERLRLPSFSTGQIMRQAIADDSPLGEVVRPYVENGTMVPGGCRNEYF